MGEGILYVYIHLHGISISRQTDLNYLLEAYVANILASNKTSSDYMAHENIIPTFYCS